MEAKPPMLGWTPWIWRATWKEEGDWRNPTTVPVLMSCEDHVTSYLIGHGNVHYFPRYYSVMLRCWDDDPEGRPTFSQLVRTLAQMINTLSSCAALTMSIIQQVGLLKVNMTIILTYPC